MDFNLIDSSFQIKPEHQKPTIHLDHLPDGLYRESSQSSDFEFSPPHFHNSSTPFFDMNNPNQIPFCNDISFQKINSMEAMREMIFRMAMMQPVQIDPEAVKLPKRKNVKISKDPQSVAARHRRERISQRIKVLQRMVPGGTKLDTASMLDEAVHYLKFLKKQLESLEMQAAAKSDRPINGFFPVMGSMQMLS